MEVDGRRKQEPRVDWCASERDLFVTSFLRPRPWGLCGKHRLVGKEKEDQACVWHSAGSRECTQNEHSHFLALNSWGLVWNFTPEDFHLSP